MTTMTMVQAMKAEVVLTESHYIQATDRAARLVADYAKRTPSSHFGHNLAAIAAELSMVAGKLETAQAVRHAEMLEAQDSK